MSAVPLTVTVRDEVPGGPSVEALSLELLTERVTVRELIRGRVYQEVQDHNRRRSSVPFRGLVRPSAEERALNGPQEPRAFRPIDWKAQYDRAVEAFVDGQILVLVDDRQVEAIDEEVTLRAGSEVTFLRLTMLVGG